MSGVSEALAQLKAGGMIVLIDDEDRENEGDLVLAAQFATGHNINFMATQARGLICLALDGAIVDQLGLPLMVANNRSQRKTAFTISIEAREGTSTGISTFDRAKTIQAAVSAYATARDLVSPGHVFPLRAMEGGVIARNGHTEGSVDLVRMAGLRPAAVICEIMNDDGHMARLPELRAFAERYQIPILSIADVVAYRIKNEILVEEIGAADMPSHYAPEKLKVRAFRSLVDGQEHLALVKGSPANGSLVRLHSECLTGDALGSLRCDCGAQLQAALGRIGTEQSGILIYLTNHEGRGIGLANKIRAYALQDMGLDTVEANTALGFVDDGRDYNVAAQILKTLGVSQIRLLTNNPRKAEGLRHLGVEILEEIPLVLPANPHNASYLATKRDKLGHRLF